MVIWGYRSFENNAAVRWLTKDLLRSPPGSKLRIQDTFEMFGEWGRGKPEELMSVEVLAACEAIAAVLGTPSPAMPSALLDWAAGSKRGFNDALVARAM